MRVYRRRDGCLWRAFETVKDEVCWEVWRPSNLNGWVEATPPRPHDWPRDWWDDYTLEWIMGERPPC